MVTRTVSMTTLAYQGTPPGDRRRVVACLGPGSTGRVTANEFNPPTIAQAFTDFDAAGKRHVIVVPATGTTNLHTSWDVARQAVGSPVSIEQRIGTTVRPSGATVWYTPLGHEDTEVGGEVYRAGMRFQTEAALHELFERNRHAFRHLLGH